MGMFQNWFKDLCNITGCDSPPKRIDIQVVLYTNKFKAEMKRQERLTKLKNIDYDNAIEYEQFIGLSLSQCIKDIANGYIHIDQVIGIIAGTNFNSDNTDQCYKIISMYSKTTWKGQIKSSCIDIFNHFLTKNLIIQPRKAGNPINDIYTTRPGPNISGGHWIPVNYETKTMINL